MPSETPHSPREQPTVFMPAKWVNLIDDGLDDNFEGFLSLMEQFAGQNMVPVPSHILQLVGLIVNSMTFLHPTTLSTHLDPIVPTGKKIAVRAYQFMDSLIRTSGPQTFLKALPGHNCIRDIYGRSHAPLDLDIVTKASFNHRDCHPFLMRIVDASYIWEILANLEPSTQQTVSPGGWDLLHLLIAAWEMDCRNHGILTLRTPSNQPHNQAKPCFPHILRQFTPAPTSGFRLDVRVLDIILEPFLSKSTAPDYVWGCTVSTRHRAQQLTMRLYHLLEWLDRKQLFESSRLREDTVNRMRALETPNLHNFINSLPLDHTLRIRLLTRFIESMTRAPSHTSPKVLIPSNTQSSSKNSPPACSSVSGSNNGSSGLRRTHSRSTLRLDDRNADSSVSPNSEPKLLSLSSLISRLLLRPLLEIPTSKVSRIDTSILLNAESRYLSALNVLLKSLLTIYEPKIKKKSLGLNLVREGRLQSAVDGLSDQVTHVCGSKLNELKEEKTQRALLYSKLNRSIKAFACLLSIEGNVK